MLDLETYVLFLLSLKKENSGVDFNHIEEKARRDMGDPGRAAVARAVQNLIDRGEVAQDGRNYHATVTGRTRFWEMFPDLADDLGKVNKDWTLVYVAKNYYPEVASEITSLCRHRYVGFFCVFTGDHFFRRKLGKDYITLRGPQDLLRLVDMHYVDVIPCVHEVGNDRPDWLVVDLDPGTQVPFDQVKKATLLVDRVLRSHGLKPALKFSGSRGFQAWAHIAPFDIPKAYVPLSSRDGQERARDHFSLFADMVAYVEAQIRDAMGGTTTTTIADRAARRDRILVDSSSMKPMGLVRSPYSLHHKTGLVSLPLSREEIPKFRPSMARPDLVLKRFRRRGNEFGFPQTDAGGMLASCMQWTEEYNTKARNQKTAIGEAR